MFPSSQGPNVTPFKEESGRIIMLVPFHRQQRGNAITALRIFTGLTERGWPIELLSLEHENTLKRLEMLINEGQVRFIHGFNALHMSVVMDTIHSIIEYPLLLTMTGTDLHYGLKDVDPSKALRVMKRAQGIVIFNPQFIDQIMELYPGARDKTSVIPQGVWLEKAAPLNRSEQELIFLLPSGLRAVKNLHLAVNGLSLAHAKFPQIRLIIVGAAMESDYAANLLHRVSNLTWVSYMGEIPHQTMASIYDLCDIVINSSLSEGQPQAALEAMSMGKPALLSAVSGNLGIMEHGREGYYFRTGEELAHFACLLAADTNKRQIMGRAAELLVKERFSVAAEIDAYEVIYSQFMNSKQA